MFKLGIFQTFVWPILSLNGLFTFRELGTPHKNSLLDSRKCAGHVGGRDRGCALPRMYIFESPGFVGS
jgi:hypothetical protein